MLYGDPSTSFAILLGGECRLLIDLGYGVVRQALRLLKALDMHVAPVARGLDRCSLSRIGIRQGAYTAPALELTWMLNRLRIQGS